MSTLKEQLVVGSTIVGAVIACIAIGYSIGKDTNDGLVNFLREKSQIAEKTETQLRGEISSLKLELQSSKEMATTSLNLPLSGKASSIASATGVLASKPTSEINAESVEIRTGETARIFNGKISISLVGITFEGDPLRHRASLTIGAPGKPNKTIEKVDVGFAILYEGYEIRVLSSDTFTVNILSTRIKGKT